MPKIFLFYLFVKVTKLIIAAGFIVAAEFIVVKLFIDLKYLLIKEDLATKSINSIIERFLLKSNYLFKEVIIKFNWGFAKLNSK